MNLPADAKVTIDDRATTSTSAQRRFTTPDLATEMEYSYTVKAEIVREGQTLTATQRVTVRAGEVTHLSLSAEQFATGNVAAK